MKLVFEVLLEKAQKADLCEYEDVVNVELKHFLAQSTAKNTDFLRQLISLYKEITKEFATNIKPKLEKWISDSYEFTDEEKEYFLLLNYQKNLLSVLINMEVTLLKLLQYVGREKVKKYLKLDPKYSFLSQLVRRKKEESDKIETVNYLAGEKKEKENEKISLVLKDENLRTYVNLFSIIIDEIKSTYGEIENCVDLNHVKNFFLLMLSFFENALHIEVSKLGAFKENGLFSWTVTKDWEVLICENYGLDEFDHLLLFVLSNFT